MFDEPRALDALHRMAVALDRMKVAEAFAMLAAQTAAETAEEFCTYLHNYIDGYFARARAGQDVALDLKNLIGVWVANVYYAGLGEGGIEAEDIDDDDIQAVDTLTAEQLSFVDGFADAIVAAKADKDLRDSVNARAETWCRTMAAIGQSALNSAKANEVVVFALVGEDSEDGCDTCAHLLGQQHRRKWVVANGYEVKPGNTKFKCGCWNCPHDWVPANA